MSLRSTIPIFGKRKGIIEDHPYDAILAKAVLEGFTTPSPAQNAVNRQKIDYLISTGIWSDLKVLWVANQESGLQDFCKINWIDPDLYTLYNSTPANEPTHDAGNGYLGGASKHFMTGLNLNAAFPVIGDNFSYFANFYNIPSTYSSPFNQLGGRVSNNNTQILWANTSSGGVLRRTFTSNGLTLAQASQNGFFLAHHIVTLPTGFTYNYREGVLFDTTSTTNNVFADIENVFMGYNNNGSIVSSGTDGGIKYHGIGVGSTIPSNQTILRDILNGTYTP